MGTRLWNGPELQGGDFRLDEDDVVVVVSVLVWLLGVVSGASPELEEVEGSVLRKEKFG